MPPAARPRPMEATGLWAGRECALAGFPDLLSRCLCLLSTGGMQDYNYVWADCFEITLELSCCKYPPASELQQEWENNRESLLTFIEQVSQGPWGRGHAAKSPGPAWCRAHVA